jgi:cytochrome b
MQIKRETVPVWDPFIRIFHWSLALAYLGAWASAEAWPQLHEQLGYFIVVLIGLRLVWGVLGTRHARFSDFVRDPRNTLTYLRSLRTGQPQHYLGHNPAGGWMVIALLASLTGAAASGILMRGGAEAWEDLHEVLAGLSLLLIAIHVAGVFVASTIHRENLVKAMLTGNKIGRGADV